MTRLTTWRPVRISSSHSWLALMFVTGLCSLVYELALAQLLSGLLGNALARFSTTLGVYVAGLGLGSILFRQRDQSQDGKSFVTAEIALAWTGFLSPLLLTGAFVFAQKVFLVAQTRNDFVLVVAHIVIFATGYFSGFELPILSAISERQSPGTSSSVLVADYAGMFAASLLFPFALYPFYGVVGSLWAASLVNVVAAICAYWLSSQKSRFLLVTVLLSALINLIGLAASNDIQNWLSQLYVARF